MNVTSRQQFLRKELLDVRYDLLACRYQGIIDIRETARPRRIARRR
jgi:hypothetical protein